MVDHTVQWFLIDYSHVGDLQLVTIKQCWRQNSDLGEIIWMLVTKIAKTVTKILKLSLTHFVYNIRHQHRCSCFNKIYEFGISNLEREVEIITHGNVSWKLEK